MNVKPYSDCEVYQCGVSGLSMQAIMNGNCPFEAGAKFEYGVVSIAITITNNEFPTDKQSKNTLILL
jgi:hypothetical protein